MKNKKIIYGIIVIVILIVIIIVIVAIASNKPMPIDRIPQEDSLVVKTIQEELKQKNPNKEYLKLKGGEILTGDNISTYIILSIISVLGIATTVVINNKKKREN